MTAHSMKYLEPLSFESRMEVQESNILYSSRSVPSVQSWRLPPHCPPGKELPVQQHSRVSTKSGQLCPDRGCFVVFEQFNLSDLRFLLIMRQGLTVLCHIEHAPGYWSYLSHEAEHDAEPRPWFMIARTVIRKNKEHTEKSACSLFL